MESLRQRKTVEYVYNHAFMTCDCGRELIMQQRSFGSSTYEGECQKCGKIFRLRQGIFWHAACLLERRLV